MQGKAFLTGLIEEMMKQYSFFEPKKVEALQVLGMMNSITCPKVIAKNIDKVQKKTVEECQHHILGFKLGAFKEAKISVKGT